MTLAQASSFFFLSQTGFRTLADLMVIGFLCPLETYCSWQQSQPFISLCTRWGLSYPYDIQALCIKYAWTLEMKINFGNALPHLSLSFTASPFECTNMPSSAFVSSREFIISFGVTQHNPLRHGDIDLGWGDENKPRPKAGGGKCKLLEFGRVFQESSPLALMIHEYLQP